MLPLRSILYNIQLHDDNGLYEYSSLFIAKINDGCVVILVRSDDMLTHRKNCMVFYFCHVGKVTMLN